MQIILSLNSAVVVVNVIYKFLSNIKLCKILLYEIYYLISCCNRNLYIHRHDKSTNLIR